MRRQAKRFNVLACGRRFGKTVLGVDVLAEVVLDGYPVAWFSPTYKMLAEVWSTIKDLLQPVVLRVNEQQHRLDLLGGGSIDMWSLDSADTVRGRAYRLIVVDEAAQVPNLLQVWEQVIRPTLTDHRGEAWFLSTPRGLNGFHTLYQRGQDSEPDWQSWRFSSADNPHINPDEFTAAERQSPTVVVAQEYHAEFVADGTGVFRNVLLCVNDERHFDPEPGHKYGFGIDWGQTNDFTAISVMDIHTRDQVWIERFNRIEWEFQYARIRVLADRYHPVMSLVEMNSIGRPGLEALNRAGLRVHGWIATNATKAQVIQDLSLAFDRGETEIGILDDTVQTGELLAYTSERLPSGLLRYGAPEGMHDDTVIALALSWQLARRPVEQGRLLDFAVEE